MSAPRDVGGKLRQTVWDGSIPLEIRLHKGDCITYDESEPYLILFPRLSYLGLLIDRLHAFFKSSLIYPDVEPHSAWLSYEGVPLKWHYPLGLLYDLYSGAEPFYSSDSVGSSRDREEQDEEEESRDETSLPWKLTVHFSDFPQGQMIQLDALGKHMHDLYINNVKEADYLRNGTGKTIMSLNKEDSTQLWDAVKAHDFSLFNPINQKLLNPQGVNLRHVPVKLYLPHASSETQEEPVPGSLMVIQGLITPSLTSRQPQTVGTALHQIIPSLFPSRQTPINAQPVLHGAVLPLKASIEELLQATAYLDGWLHIAIVMLG